MLDNTCISTIPIAAYARNPSNAPYLSELWGGGNLLVSHFYILNYLYIFITCSIIGAIS